VRAVIELAGIKNILSKALGSNNKINNVMATLEALRRLQRPVPSVEPVASGAVTPPALSAVIETIPPAPTETAEAPAPKSSPAPRVPKLRKKSV